MEHHAFVIEAEVEEGIRAAEAFAKKELGMKIEQNPDVIVFRYGLFGIENARNVAALASQAPLMADKKVVIVAATRVYHEAQNALLKLFEEPAEGTYLFLILPTLGALLPTLRSRVQILNEGRTKSIISEAAEAFLKANKEKRTTLIKKLETGKDEDERRENRDTALEIVNGVEQKAHEALKEGNQNVLPLLTDIAELRTFMYDRAAPVRMILEHISLVLPRKL